MADLTKLCATSDIAEGTAKSFEVGNNVLASMSGLGQACILTDKTGSTKQGSFLINGSFLVPMLLCAVFSVAAGLLIQAVVY